MNATLEGIAVIKQQLGSGNEVIVRPELKNSILEIPATQLRSLVAEHGVILLRGFEVSDDVFSKFVHQSSARVTVDPARQFVSKNAQLVDAGLGPVGLHCENGNAPRLPHLLWFHCTKAAKQGSYTTFCDGERAWLAMPKEIQEQFLGQKITYRRSISEVLWKNYVYHELGGFDAPQEVEFKDLENLARSIDGQRFELKENGSVFSEFRVSAVHASLFSKKLSFANSLLGPSYNYESPVISFENGAEIPQSTLEIIDQVTDACTDEIPWQDGDVVVIDNTRYMHGRRKILDKNRRICAALSYI
jgi:alpha-ketoglutarate-dependent taurine dioxygenase